MIADLVSVGPSGEVLSVFFIAILGLFIVILGGLAYTILRHITHKKKDPRSMKIVGWCSVAFVALIVLLVLMTVLGI